MADRYTIAAVNNALKVVALPRIQKQFNNFSFLLNKLKRGTPKLALGGRSIDLSLKVGGSASWRTLDEIAAMDRQTVVELLGIDLSPVRLKCALLGLVVTKIGMHDFAGTEMPVGWEGMDEIAWQKRREAAGS